MQEDLRKSGKAQIISAQTYGVFKRLLEESNCRLCPLSKSRSNIVVDRGNPESAVVMIGEAPGENEDLQKKAFVGRSGRLLDDMMSRIGFDTNRDAIIINIVKCRPPKNRAPKSEEASACRPYFEKQVSFFNPKVILLLGATALKYFVPRKKNFSMSKTAGKFFDCPEFPGAKVMALYHPAYLLRDPRKKPAMMRHLKQFKVFWAQAR